MVINIGRGRHVVGADLIAALDSGQLSYAALGQRPSDRHLSEMIRSEGLDGGRPARDHVSANQRRLPA